MTRIKICGITGLSDALAAVQAGADALGFVFYPKSPRHIFPDDAARIIKKLPPFLQVVGLFVNEPPEVVNQVSRRCQLGLVQLHGDESPEYCRKIDQRVIRAFRIRDRDDLKQIAEYRNCGTLLDAWCSAAYGGTGKSFNWGVAAEAVSSGQQVILAGGLTPENVAEAIRQVKPYAVDVSSGVESSPGVKDPEKMLTFIRAARGLLP